MDSKDNTATKELDTDIHLPDPTTETLPADEDIFLQRTIGEVLMQEFYTAKQGDINQISKFIDQFEDPNVRMVLFEKVLFSTEEEVDLFLSKDEESEELEEFLVHACDNFKNFFQKLRFVELMKDHLERTDISKYPFREDYIFFERKIYDKELAKIIQKTNSKKGIHYESFYYPNYIINRKNILESRLGRDLKNPKFSFSEKELDDIRGVILKGGSELSMEESLILKMIDEKLFEMFNF